MHHSFGDDYRKNIKIRIGNVQYIYILKLCFFPPSLHHAARRVIMSPLVEDALSSHHPVVALESTIITHGMPFPQNLETAMEVEEAIKKEV